MLADHRGYPGNFVGPAAKGRNQQHQARIHFCEVLPKRHGQAENGPVSSYSSAPSNIAAAVISTRLTDWGFAPEVVEAMRTAYRMACDTPELRCSADERTAMVAEKIIELAQAGETDPTRLCTGALRRLTH
jgi:hypothetical protein